MAAAAIAAVKIEFEFCSAVRAGNSVLAEHILVKIYGIVAGGALYFIKLLVIVTAVAVIIAAITIVIAVNNVFNIGKILVHRVKLLHKLIAAVLYFAYLIGDIAQNIDNSGKNFAFLCILVERKTLGKTLNISYLLTDIHFTNLRF